MINGSMKISEHFTLDELTVTSTGIDNVPDEKVIANLKRLAVLLEKVRTVLGKPISVNSAYRSPAVNKAVGGVKDSQHVLGQAADIKVAGMSPYEVCMRIAAADLEGVDQLILEDLGSNGGWTHISVPDVGKKPRYDLFTIRKGTGYVRGIHNAA